MSKLITFLILFYLIYRGSKILINYLKVPGADKTKVGGQNQVQRKLNIDSKDIEDADFKDINHD
ncbi:MAG TPA: hypothetical protein DHU63_07665 [Candidatus Marinimicrobia bacterium]|nr:MAG: hypothetical protein AUJ47_02385 [Candidatus Marinimicrobia bacterium CG1_02_48_14]PIZ65999.1 MAG: hypothetical protein COY19_07305 [Candidatus Marinimicrobia bacterium CG_4_10_14_0_2_um_filter_48_9]PJA52154.1 MAG: hypothetical protein CO167_10095 [Candidatus Marinimicrobia bacterium CG_4_9_14_3_um_filter_48_9]HCW76398.1 hypothetical protein [Candidatus Neomarinimicrobiota bacterium]